jgi:hypothetical protein
MARPDNTGRNARIIEMAGPMEPTAALAVRFGGQSGPRDVHLVARSGRSTGHTGA